MGIFSRTIAPSTQRSERLCKCGIKPAHKPKIDDCVEVALAAGYKATPMGFIVDKKRHRFFDGSVWLSDKS